jgi:tetratricopeptide (TPR) repeat protein
MASKKTVTPDNLVALGLERLAAILIELADGDAEVKRRLRLELAAQAGGDTIAAEIGKRLAALRSARSFVDWQQRRDFVKDLDLQRAMIVDRVAQTRADLALDLMWRFMDLAAPVLNRVDDSNGSVGDVFRAACEDLGTIAAKVKPDPVNLADRVFAAVQANDYGVFDGLVAVMLPALGEAGAAHLKERLRKVLADRSGKAGERDYHARVVRAALQALADGQSDVDAYTALVPPEERRMPHQGAEIGRRLLAAGRAAEALAALERARPKRSAARAVRDDDDLYLIGLAADDEWEEAYIEALEATGRKDEAQRLRWAAFEERLSADRLRAHLKRLPDFDDVEAEERAMKHALGFRSFAAALGFFTGWPDQARAAQLVLARASEIDGNLYHLLDPAARLIEGKHPLAATLLQRAMVEDALDGAKSTRYKHAARHLLECRSLAAGIRDFGTFETHEAFVGRLRARHGRKTGFWSQVSEVSGGRD